MLTQLSSGTDARSIPVVGRFSWPPRQTFEILLNTPYATRSLLLPRLQVSYDFSCVESVAQYWVVQHLWSLGCGMWARGVENHLCVFFSGLVPISPLLDILHLLS